MPSTHTPLFLAIRFEPSQPPRTASVPGDLLGLRHTHLGLLDGRDVDQLAVKGHGTHALLRGVLHGLEDALRLGHLLLGGAVDLVRKLDLARVDCPLALAAEHSSAAGLGLVASGVGEVAEGTVHWAEAVGVRSDHDARDRVVPHVTPVVVTRLVSVFVRQHTVLCVGAANARGACLGGGRIIRHTEVQRLVALGGASDGIHVRHAERRLDDQLEANLLLAALTHLTLRDQHVHGVDV
mmetsp:Transcript_16687/g.22992  ORF Transcript_16687/g.22992 Transcript_16687/m.22992 type:complete len:238 (-) Transcript_16687:488-1201(-)